MKLGITVWDERIAPVFDAAHSLLIVDIKNGTIKKVAYESFSPKPEALFAEKLTQQRIEVFICGAISQAHSTLIEACGIQLISFISGSVNKVLESYVKSNSLGPGFLMPGCRDDQSFV